MKNASNETKEMSNAETSVTRWLDYFYNIWPFTKLKSCPKFIKTTKGGSKIAKHKINPQKFA